MQPEKYPYYLRVRMPGSRPFDLVITILFLITALNVPGCTKLSDYDTARRDLAVNDSLVQTTESWNAALTLMDKEQIRVRIQAEHAITWHKSDKQDTQLEGSVVVEILDSLGVVKTTANAGKATYRAREGEFELFDEVFVVSVADDGERTLRTHYLFWDDENDRISSNQLVTIVTPTDSITGTQFESSTDLKQYTIISPRGRSEVD